MKRAVIGILISFLVVLFSAVSCRKALTADIELALTQTALAPYVATRVAAAQQTGEPADWDDLLTITPTNAVAGAIGFLPAARTPTPSSPTTQVRTTQPTATYSPGQPTLTRTPTAAFTSSPATTATEEPTEPTGPTEPPEPTPTLETGWEGEWIAYYGPESALISGSLDISQNGDAIFAIANLDGATMTLNGTLSSQGTIAGSYQYRGESGIFYWQLVSGQQIAGSVNDDLAFCAARYSSVRPQPCLLRSGFE
jgi:hypothetical protein